MNDFGRRRKRIDVIQAEVKGGREGGRKGEREGGRGKPETPHIPAPSRAVHSTVIVGGKEEGETIRVKGDHVSGGNLTGLYKGDPFALEDTR